MYSPAEISERVAAAGETKTRLSALNMLLLGIFAGAFIALAGVAATFANVYVGKLAGACVFPCGLAMVVVAGSELFTGNNLIIISVLEKRSTVGGMLKNWVLVYLGNLIGSLLVVVLSVYGGVFSNPDVAAALVSTAAAKASISLGDALLKGILCNFLVCVAVWMSFGTKTAEGKILVVFFPIMAFVLSGFEHSVANMFYLPGGILTAAKYGIDAAGLTLSSALLHNLLPVTIGNILGGSVLVGCGYWAVYLRKK